LGTQQILILENIPERAVLNFRLPGKIIKLRKQVTVAQKFGQCGKS
jgi:hypothetical protein